MGEKPNKPDVTISPEMIEAGCAALRELGLDWDMWDSDRQTEIVAAIFRAMVAVRLDNSIDPERRSSPA